MSCCCCCCWYPFEACSMNIVHVFCYSGTSTTWEPFNVLSLGFPWSEVPWIGLSPDSGLLCCKQLNVFSLIHELIVAILSFAILSTTQIWPEALILIQTVQRAVSNGRCARTNWRRVEEEGPECLHPERWSRVPSNNWEGSVLGHLICVYFSC